MVERWWARITHWASCLRKSTRSPSESTRQTQAERLQSGSYRRLRRGYQNNQQLPRQRALPVSWVRASVQVYWYARESHALALPHCTSARGQRRVRMGKNDDRTTRGPRGRHRGRPIKYYSANDRWKAIKAFKRKHNNKPWTRKACHKTYTIGGEVCIATLWCIRWTSSFYQYLHTLTRCAHIISHGVVEAHGNKTYSST